MGFVCWKSVFGPKRIAVERAGTTTDEDEAVGGEGVKAKGTCVEEQVCC